MVMSFVAIQGRAGLHGTVVAFAGQQVEQAISVGIHSGHAPPRVAIRAGIAVLGNIREHAVAVVAKEDAPCGQCALLAMSAIGNVEVEPAVIREIDKKGTAALAGSTQLLLIVEAKLAALVAEKNARLGTGVVEGADEEIGPIIAIHIAPGGGVTAKAGEVRKDTRLLSGISKDKRRG